MQKTKEQLYEMIREFMQADKQEHPEFYVQEEYDTYISDLWPVLGKCLEIAQANQNTMVRSWLAIASVLYKVPQDIKPLYEVVCEFIHHWNILNGGTPSSALETNGKDDNR